MRRHVASNKHDIPKTASPLNQPV